MRHRFQFKFWLDVNKPDERELAEQLDSLKARRQFAPTLRDALRLFLDLKEGRTEVLRELFPGIGLTPAMDFEAIIQQAANASAERVASATPPPALPLPAQQELPGINGRRIAERDSSGDDDLLDLLEITDSSDSSRADGKSSAGENLVKSMMAWAASTSPDNVKQRSVKKHVTDLAALIEVTPAKTK